MAAGVSLAVPVSGHKVAALSKIGVSPPGGSRSFFLFSCQQPGELHVGQRCDLL